MANFKIQAVKAARAADSKKAEHIKLIFLGARGALADYILIAEVDSPPQLEAVEDEISRVLKDEGILKLHRDGQDSAAWRVLDYGGFLAHLITPELRSFYGLDRVYHGGKEVNWKPEPKRRRSAPAKKPAARRRVSPR